MERRQACQGAPSKAPWAVKYLLDTHALVWWVTGSSKLTRAQRRAIASAGAQSPLGLSDISIWEIAALHELRRLKLTLPLREWLDRAVAEPLVRRVDLAPAIVVEMSSLAATPGWDPADRLIVATARVHGLRLITSDTRIVDSGLVATVN
jgi:PIN domain nuclease of toxin-antitoxin system